MIENGFPMYWDQSQLAEKKMTIYWKGGREVFEKETYNEEVNVSKTKMV
jgi:hypothetical protein